MVSIGYGRGYATNRPKTKLRGLLLASVIVTATHPLLDWTNNYGIRFFLPWSSKWFYGDLVFIVDPYMWLILGGASFLLSAKTKSGKVIWGALAVGLTALVIGSPRGGGLPNPWLVHGGVDRCDRRSDRSVHRWGCTPLVATTSRFALIALVLVVLDGALVSRIQKPGGW